MVLLPRRVALPRADERSGVPREAGPAGPARVGDLWRLDCAGPPLATIRTGLGIDGRPLAGRSVDPRWTIAESPDPGAYGPEAYAVPPGEFPVPPWIGDGDGSRWISPGAADTLAAPGRYTYRSTFDLSGPGAGALVLEGRYSADDSLHDVLLNGRSTGIEGNSPGFFEAWHPIEVPGEFRAGENRLDFVVVNGGADANPAGLRVELTLRSRSTVPGDLNLDLEVDVSDAVSLLDSLFVAGETPRCPGAADFNEDGSTDISDAVAILLYLFAGRPAPAAGEVQCLEMPPIA